MYGSLNFCLFSFPTYTFIIRNLLLSTALATFYKFWHAAHLMIIIYKVFSNFLLYFLLLWIISQKVKVKVTQLCRTLCHCIVHGILQARILSGYSFPLISSSTLGTYRPGGFLLQYPIILPSHTVHGALKARVQKWFAIPFSSGSHFVRPLHYDLTVLGGPQGLA